MLFVLGQVYDRELKDVDARHRDLSDHPRSRSEDDRRPSRPSIASTSRRGRWYDLLQILEREVELPQSTGESGLPQVPHRAALGEGAEGSRRARSRPIATSSSVDGNHEPTLQALDGLVHGEQEPVLAAQVLEPIFEAGGEWERLIDVLEVMVKHADDPVPQASSCCTASRTITSAASRTPGRPSRPTVARCTRTRPNETTIAHLERLAGSPRAGGAGGALRGRARPAHGAARVRSRCCSRVARVYELEELERRQGDRHLPPRARDRRGEQDAILALDRLYQRQGGLARAIRDPASRDPPRRHRSGDHRAAVPARSALRAEPVGHRRRARGVSRDPDVRSQPLRRRCPRSSCLFAEGQRQIEIAAVLEPLYRLGEQWEKLVKINEVQLGKIEGQDDRLQMIQRIAEVYEHRLVDQGSAFVWWAQALREVPRSELAGEEVERLARATHGWDELAQVCRTVIEEHGASHRPRRTRTCSGSCTCGWRAILEEELHDVTKAEEAYLQVLSIDGNRRRRWSRSIASTAARRCGRAGRHPASPHRHHHRHRGDRRAVLPARPRLLRHARRPDEAVGAYSAILDDRFAQHAGARGPRAGLLPSWAVGRAVRRLREDGRHRAWRRGHGRVLRAHGEDRLRRPRRPRAGPSTCGVVCSTCAARIRSR